MKRFIVLLLACIIIVSFLGIFSKKSTNKNLNSPTEIAISRAIDTSSAGSKISAIGFYSAYDTCLNQPPYQAAGRVSTYCQEHNPYAGSDLVKHFKNTGADPFTCSPNPPQSYEVKNVYVDGVTARALVTEIYGTSSQIVSLTLLKENNLWKVNMITCPTSPK